MMRFEFKTFLFTSTLLLGSAVAGSACKQEPGDARTDVSCSEVGQWALRQCLQSTDDATCETVYGDAAEACRLDVAEGRRVCLPSQYTNRCVGYVVPKKEP